MIPFSSDAGVVITKWANIAIVIWQELAAFLTDFLCSASGVTQPRSISCSSNESMPSTVWGMLASVCPRLRSSGEENNFATIYKILAELVVKQFAQMGMWHQQRTQSDLKFSSTRF